MKGSGRRGGWRPLKQDSSHADRLLDHFERSRIRDRMQTNIEHAASAEDVHRQGPSAAISGRVQRVSALADGVPTMRSISPFRYPGGKAFLYKYLLGRVNALPDGPRYYAEPFCGGAGAATILLKLDAVDEIHLNDADPKIYSAWKAILDEPDRFAEAILNTPINLETWQSCRNLAESNNECSFELGFATFFLNRTSRSGIVVGAGPIGGYGQRGNWKIDARFNRDDLIERVRWLGSMKRRIKLTREDALTFLSRSPERIPLNNALFFVDPPYVTAGGRLYLNAMNEGKHIALSDMLQDGTLPHWVLTYDDHPLIRDLYGSQTITDLAVTYSLQNKRKEREVLINDYAA
jgi:DNA adenine methylase